ncbi:MAG: ABC transporter ATP-binding protein [Acidobacteria bacterium]|nr:ABC transporter ATP-binding protein [Acidobacteriota bacterium]
MVDMWRRVLPYLRRYKGRLAFGFTALVLCRVFYLIVPQVLERAVDALEAGATSEMWTYGGFIVAAAGGSAVFRYFMRWYLIGVSRFAEYDLRRDFYLHLQRLPAAFYARFRVGDILSRGAQDMNAVRMVLGPGLMYPVETVFTTVGCFAFMLAISPRLTLVALAVMPVVSILMKILGEKIFRRSEVVQAKMADISAVVQENAAAARLVRAFVQEDAQRKVFGKENEAYAARSMELVAVSAALFPLLLALIGMGLAGSLVLGGRMVIEGAISLGELVAFLFYYGYLTWPMIAIGWVVNIHQRGAASMKRLAVIFDAEPLPAPPAVPEPAYADRPAAGIEFRDVRFAYPSAAQNGAANSNGAEPRPVLSDFNLRIEPGQTVAFVGRTGSGKSTVARLIPRIYDAQEGSIRIDGRDVREIPLHELRSDIGFVPQDSFLFSMTLRDNLAFGDDDAPMDEVHRVAEEAGLAGDIGEFADGYDTMVGERGITLSGGQRQRAAIARALLLDSRILVFDDVLSAVDSETESRILGAVRRASRDRTTVIVAHRLSTVKDADVIYLLDADETGATRVVESGTHDDLVAAGGLYAGMYRRQMLEEELSRL